MTGGRGSLALGLALLAAIIVMANVIVARHPSRADWTPGAIYTLSPKTRAVLGALRDPVQVTVFIVPPDRFTSSVYHDVRELLTRFGAATPRLGVEYVDVDGDPARVETLARRHGIQRRDLREGVIVFSVGDRSKHVRVPGIARYDGKRLVALRAEAALLSALVVVTADRNEEVCFTAGHGEAGTSSYDGAGYGYFADEVRRAGFGTRTLEPRDLAAGTKQCRAVIVGGPTRVLGARELAALDRQLERGAGVLVLAGPVLGRGVTRYRRTGLSPWLRGWGVSLPANVVVDPAAMPGEQRYLSWGTRTGYHRQHRVTRSLAGRLTIWRLAREVRLASPSAEATNKKARQLERTVLVRTGPGSWGETDLRSLRGERPLKHDPAVDSAGPVSVAVAVRDRRRGGRLVVIGSERGVLNRRIDDERDHSRDLVLGALSWVAGQDRLVPLGPKKPQHLRLSIDQRGLTRVFLLAVIVMPAVSLFFALFVWRRRRR